MQCDGEEQPEGRNHAMAEDRGVQTQVASESQRLWGQHEISMLAPAGSGLWAPLLIPVYSTLVCGALTAT